MGYRICTMKFCGVIVSIVLIIFFGVSVALAHGGVEKSTDRFTVILYQDPLSPLVGEEITFSFLVTDRNTRIRLAGKEVTISVTETTLGDESKDRIIHEQQIQTDVNGAFSFSYAFSQPTYYDIELALGERGDELTTVGFLVQPRLAAFSPDEQITQLNTSWSARPIWLEFLLFCSLFFNVIAIWRYFKIGKRSGHRKRV
jgi:hypothetical protein